MKEGEEGRKGWSERKRGREKGGKAAAAQHENGKEEKRKEVTNFEYVYC